MIETRHGDQIVIRIVGHDPNHVIDATEIEYNRGAFRVTPPNLQSLRLALSRTIRQWSKELQEGGGNMGNKLPCGCVLGRFLCPIAEALWAGSNAAYKTWQATRSKQDMEASYQAWLKYTNDRHCYDAHVKGERTSD